MSFIVDRKRGFDGIPMARRNGVLYVDYTGMAVAQSKFEWMIGIAPFSYVSKVFIEHLDNGNACSIIVILYNTYSTDMAHQIFYKRIDLATSTAQSYVYDVHLPLRDILGIRIYNAHATVVLKAVRVIVEIAQNREGKI